MFSALKNSTTVKIWTNHAKFAAEQIPQLAAWGVPAALAGYSTLIVQYLLIYLNVFYLKVLGLLHLHCQTIFVDL
jgi:hypothetical protein